MWLTDQRYHVLIQYSCSAIKAMAVLCRALQNGTKNACSAMLSNFQDYS